MKNLTTILIASIIMVSTPADAKNQKKDPKVVHEGSKESISHQDCLEFGGSVSDSEQNHFTCIGGKYDNYVTTGPATDPEEDDPNEEL